MVVWEVPLEEVFNQDIAVPLRTHRTVQGDIGTGLRPLPRPDRVRENRSVLCRHGERGRWEYGGYSRTAEDYHVWQCTVGTCKSTMIRECTSRVRVDRECTCFTQEEVRE